MCSAQGIHSARQYRNESRVLHSSCCELVLSEEKLECTSHSTHCMLYLESITIKGFIVRKPTRIISQDIWWDITWCNVNIVPDVL